MPSSTPSNSPFSVNVTDVTIDRDGRRVIEHVTVTIDRHTRLAVVGPNGVGKSTFFAALAGDLPASRGSIRTAPPGTTIGVLGQELETADPSVRSWLRRRTGVGAAEDELTAAAQALADDTPGAADRYDRALGRWTRIGAADFDPRVEALAPELGVDARLLDRAPGALSGGQASRVGLLAIELSAFDLTLLDEPTNGLDAEGLAILDRWIERRQGGLAVISHDRAFLERVATAVLEFDEHSASGTVFHGGWAGFVEERERERARRRDAHDRAVAERDRLRVRAQRQREWADRGVQRENKRPRDGDKNIRRRELARTDKLVAGARRVGQAADRIEVPDAPFEGWDLRFDIAEAGRSATTAATWDGVIVERGDWSVGPFDLELRWGDRVALSGPNGSGKSTLIDALVGEVTPSAGRVRLGSGVVVGRLDQRRSGFVEQKPLLTAFQDTTGLTATDARSVLAKFGLGADDVERVASTLSPGERTRAQLAAFQAAGVNLLILDEPTNHLDLPAIEQLESAVNGYRGTLLVVTHDQRFREAIAIDETVDLTPRSDAG